MKRSFVFLAPGFEEIEAITPVDVMRRAGMDVFTVSVTASKVVTGAHAVPVTADLLFAEADFADCGWLVCPGGMPGATNLAAHKPLCDLLRDHYAKGGKIAAICASPAVVLAPLGILDGKEATGYPGFEASAPKVRFNGDRVVINGNVITANGPASALPFAVAIVAEDRGPEVASEVSSGMLIPD